MSRRERLADERSAGSNSMPTETKNRTAKASCSGRESAAARWLRSDLAQDHAGEEGAQRERYAEQLGRAVGDAQGHGEDGQGEQLARAGARDLPQDPGHDPLADHQHEDQEQGDLGQGERQRQARLPPPACPARPRGSPPEHAGQRRQEDQRQDHGQVLDDQPADGDPARRAVEHGPRLERAQQDHRAGDGEREAEHQAGAEATSPRERRPPSPGGWPPRSGPGRRGWRSRRTAIRSPIEKCRPTPNIRRMTPISAS